MLFFTNSKNARVLGAGTSERALLAHPGVTTLHFIPRTGMAEVQPLSTCSHSPRGWQRLYTSSHHMLLLVEHRSSWLTVLQTPESLTWGVSKGSVFLDKGEGVRIAGYSSSWGFSLSVPLKVCRQPHNNPYWWPVRRRKLWERKYLRLTGEGRGNVDGGPLRGRAELAPVTPLLACLRSSWDVFNDQFHQNKHLWRLGPFTVPTRGTVGLGFPSSHQRAI